MSYRIAIDIGGTFTDGVIENAATGEVRLAKRLTTQADPGQALADVVDDLLAAVRHLNGSGNPADAVSEVVHGSTLVTNALIERKGARTALVATEGTAISSILAARCVTTSTIWTSRCRSRWSNARTGSSLPNGSPPMAQSLPHRARLR
jgi:N-methylhydantoinase A/oxoprolinase/acetone carboxylase beta subunit